VAALEGQAREAEQLMTVDVDKFCGSLTGASYVWDWGFDLLICVCM
jgi:hypothetical protein